MSNSNVARLRECVNNEYIAAQQGLNGLAVTANHASITARMERMSERIQELLASGKKDEVVTLFQDDHLWSKFMENVQ